MSGGLPGRRRTARTARFLGLAFAALVLLLLGAALIGTIALSTGVSGFLVGLALAVPPAVMAIAAFLWVDRFEPEPPLLLAGLFAWGAVVAAAASALVNTVTSEVLRAAGTSVEEAMSTTAVLVAPVVEEGTKGAIVVLLALFNRHEFDGVVDGVVYAGFVGVGFAFTENILYFGRAFLTGADEGLETGFFAAGATFIARGVLSPFAHPLFTCCTGIGVGIAVTTRQPAMRLLAPLAGFVAAVVLHGTWNLAATGGAGGWLSTYFLLMVPLFLAAIAVVAWVRSREGRLIARQLPAYVSSGWLPPHDVAMVSSLGGRRQARSWAQAQLGKAGEEAMRDYQRAATELAFLRERAGRVGPDATYPHREQALLAMLVRSRQQLRIPQRVR
jgi:RsiW-degrading membrane proteinase PrsW (M82 family)